MTVKIDKIVYIIYTISINKIVTILFKYDLFYLDTIMNIFKNNFNSNVYTSPCSQNLMLW